MATKDILDLTVCRAVQQARDTNSFATEVLEEITGESPKVCYRALERAYRHGLVNYGVSLRTGWLTEKGLELLTIPENPNGDCEERQEGV